MEMQTIEQETTTLMYPVQFIEQESLGRIVVPLVRVHCCGMMTLEVLQEVVSTDPPLGRYEVIATHTLRGRGAVPALMLLKLLTSQPHRFASKDWLTTSMNQEMESGALIRLDTMASQLRSLLCEGEPEQTSTLRRRLVQFLHNGRGSGPGYQLAPYPLIWLDTEALAWNVRQAARMERFGEDALLWWERAYALASRGVYLPDDVYSEWTQGPREEVEGMLRQCVHALHRLYRAQSAAAGTEQALLLLRTYWLSHSEDEDALRPLMELLGQQERYQEAEDYYQQLVRALTDDGEEPREPDARTQDLREFLRTKQLRREPRPSLTTNEAASLAEENMMEERAKQPNDLLRRERELRGWSQRMVAEQMGTTEQVVNRWENGLHRPNRYFQTQLCELFGKNAEELGFLQQPAPASSSPTSVVQLGQKQHLPESLQVLLPPEGGQSVFVPADTGLFVPFSMQRQDEIPLSVDWASWFGEKLAHLLSDIDIDDHSLLSSLLLQERLDRELTHMRPQPGNEAYSNARRQTLVTLARLPLALLVLLRQESWPAGLTERFLSRTTKSVTACWHFLRGNEFATVEEVVPQYLWALTLLVEQSSTYRKPAAQLAAQCSLLMSLVARHRGNKYPTQTDIPYCRQAVLYSEAAEDAILMIAALKGLADTFYYAQQYDHMRESYEKATALMNTYKDVPPLLSSRIYAGLADAYVRTGEPTQGQQPLKYVYEMFPETLAHPSLPLYADCGIHSLFLWEGLTFFDRGDLTQKTDNFVQAQTSFTRFERLPQTTVIPERTRLELITHLAETTVRLGELEQFCSYIKQGAEGIKALGSPKRHQELIEVYRQGRSLWPHEARIQALTDVFIS